MKALERRIQAAEEALAEQGRSITMEEAIARAEFLKYGRHISTPPRLQAEEHPDEVSGFEAVILRIEREKAAKAGQG
ncbi:MAG TPA: hypothetical protein VN033_12320 [Vulgatibacter sp.]|nr:hypothetical protein [Vulgatibacter sp.]